MTFLKLDIILKRKKKWTNNNITLWAKLLQSCLNLCDRMDRSLPNSSSVHRILQARILGWVAMPSSRESSQPKDWTRIRLPALESRFLIIGATWEAPVTLALIHNSVQFTSVAQSCLTLCDPMNCSMPGLPVHHQLPEFTQTHVHPVGDAIQPSHPLSSPSPPAPNPSQHQSLFQWVNFSHEVAKVLEFQL